ncbi:hypothetical protein HK103_000142 [Boothiomyces macroporosus]|uniref:Mediator of RNA polymerase II transcription subunit 17 n=1 Tax=Boothiomyces macroporosus TaxID=261099 RepID=A0AAD5Y6R1_9FUNG|nr:hypothetical protein HK103_000142 [Boothiomyces macroporosus]
MERDRGREDDHTQTAVEKIKEIIFYAREEMQITFDIASRLVTSQALEPSALEKSEDPHLKTCVGAKAPQAPPMVQLQKAQYIEAIKNQNIDSFVQFLVENVANISKMVETSQKFFMELAFDLLKRNWVLQERNWSPIKGILFVIYGFVNDGSRLPEVGEADIWRLTLSSDTSENEGFDVILLKLIPSADVNILDWGNPLVESNSSSVIKKLQLARNSIFEKDLFGQILSDISQNEKLFKKCIITSKKIVIPLLENFNLQVTLEKAEDVHYEFTGPPDAKSYIQLLARMGLRDIHRQNLDVPMKKLPMNLTTKLKKYLEKQLLAEKINTLFTTVEELLLNCSSARLTRTATEWKLSFDLDGIREIFISCRISDHTRIYYISSQTQMLEIFSVAYLEELLTSFVIKHLFDTVVEVSNCLFQRVVIGDGQVVRVDQRNISVVGDKVANIAVKVQNGAESKLYRVAEMSESFQVEVVRFLVN